jgi:hypothetical protein
MPNQNGAGPFGQGPASGRGRGFCTDRDSTGMLPGFGRGTGRGRGIICRRPGEVERPEEENGRLERGLARLRRSRGLFRGK